MRFLASGDSYSSLSYLLKMSKQTISSIIPDVCAALISVLQDEVKKPENASDWNIIAKQFHDLWQYPNCIGAIDGKHITLQAPIHSRSEFFNYKSFHSIVLLAIVDPSYNFIYANVGCQGRISDGGVFNNTSFKEQLDTNALHLPPPCPLPGRQLPMQYCLVGDEAFQLTVNLMKPFSGTYARGYKERIFNYKLSRARRVSENAFGILSSSFRVLRKPMLLEPDTATKVTLATVYLHNYLRKTSSRSIYSPNEMFDKECPDNGEVDPGLWRRDLSSSQLSSGRVVSRRSNTEAQNARHEFAAYFCSPQGELHYQYNK
ncbi:uncharacterized protein LOC130899839 [Diorhabda carinulata]|uniref:uncharacterized protein LOC130899839 n=1 Tax=Diorhabda carinulata TaxID=1163345 RepID=UPI0025A041E7|nr:uncharacterized protein LOC130899839 [Diorhabda carinulata]